MWRRGCAPAASQITTSASVNSAWCSLSFAARYRSRPQRSEEGTDPDVNDIAMAGDPNRILDPPFVAYVAYCVLRHDQFVPTEVFYRPIIYHPSIASPLPRRPNGSDRGREPPAGAGLVCTSGCPTYGAISGAATPSRRGVTHSTLASRLPPPDYENAAVALGRGRGRKRR